MELRIFELEERLNVAAILIKNGYTVSQGKRDKGNTGKTKEYYLVVEDNEQKGDKRT